MGLEAVLRNILTPNAAMEPGYRIFRCELVNGDLVDAFYVSEDKDAFVIRQPGVPDRRLAKKDVRRTQYIRRSLMPEGLLDALNEEQVRDLLGYLMTLKG
jgi:putative heme-binding domain-containing protein